MPDDWADYDAWEMATHRPMPFVRLNRLVIANECPTCEAQPGEPCVAIRGPRRCVAHLHIGRYYLFWHSRSPEREATMRR